MSREETKVYCLTLMGEIGTAITTSGEQAIMVFSREEAMEVYLKNWEQYASVPVEVVEMDLYDLYYWLINKAPLINSIALDPSPEDDACSREVTIDHGIVYDLPFEEHFKAFKERYLGVKKLAQPAD